MAKLVKLVKVCLGFYAVSTVFQIFNGYSLQIHVTWITSNQYLTHSHTMTPFDAPEKQAF